MRRRHRLMKVLAAVFRIINRFAPWHKLPYRFLPRLSLRLWNLPALRHDLRRWNLYDTASLPVRPRPPGPPPPPIPGMPPFDPFAPPDPFKPEDLLYRRPDGSYNDLQTPKMGAPGTRYGRNMPYERQNPLAEPSPRDVSNTVLARDSFKAAESLNLLAAAWIQFMVHDWARHRPDFKKAHRTKIPLRPGDPWAKKFGDMEIERTEPDVTRPDGCVAGPPTFLNEGTFWWDGSQIYGSDLNQQRALRDTVMQNGRTIPAAKLRTVKVGNDERLPDDPLLPGQDKTGFIGGWWAGLSLLHTLFVLEHNLICDELRREYGWTDEERLFQTARLINAALMAKIHTVEWTPAILGQPVLKIGMNANWWGILGEQIYKQLGRVGKSEELSGIPGSDLDHHGVPFALTEEFVSVYRLHPLIPDEYRFHSLTERGYWPYVVVDKNGRQERQLLSTFDDIQGQKSRAALTATGMANAFYSFGLAHPGAITLGNYPHFLRQYEPPGHPHKLRMDVASIDIFRDRERGIPPYNLFRQYLRMPRVKRFDDLNPKWAQKLSDLYRRDIDRVDAMVGMFAEEFPEGFGFSDTAFRIFILMASRRLKSDRFFTTDYRPDVYTRFGMDWINDNGFESVLLRHYPALGPAVHGLDNPFQPWRNVHAA
jgi:hypothetical protein